MTPNEHSTDYIAFDRFTPWMTGRIDIDAAKAYAVATSDHLDSYLDGTWVPLLYTTALAMHTMGEALHEGLSDQAIIGYQRIAHAQHDVVFHRMLTPGSTVAWRCGITGARDTPAGALVTVRVAIVDADGNAVADHLWDSIFVGGRLTGAPRSNPQSARPSPVKPVARPRRTRRVLPVSFDQGFRYAGVTGDHVRHSMDDQAAREEGLPGKIIQGLCTFALCTGVIIADAGGGDPTSLRRIAARFSAPLRPNTDLVVTSTEQGSLEDGTRVIEFEAEASGVTVLKNGCAWLQ